jgi:hypothetical protein
VLYIFVSVHTIRIEYHERALGKEEVQNSTEDDKEDAISVRKLESISSYLLPFC